MTHASINRIYRLVFNAATGMYVAVAETARGRGKAGRSSSALLVAVAALGSSAAFAQNVLPTGGVVTSGSAAISQTSSAMTVNQSTNAAILNWQSFSIGAGNSVRFNQPSSSAVALNRVIGNSASEILGSLSANGKVLLVNQNGILMGSGAQVDTGGFMASTLNIKDSDFLAGKYIFDIANNTGGTAGTVINNGRINTPSGYTVLMAPQVTNNGYIAARAGSVAIAAGNKVSLDMVGDGLITFAVNQAALNAAVVNTGTIQANGGQVLIKASSANALFDTVLNSTGIIRADSIANVNGRIILDGGATGITQVTGELSAKGNNAGETGGTIAVLGDKVGLFNGAKLDASGDAGGGTVLVGGNWQGSGTERTASRTIMASGASIDVSANTQGNGGTAVVWADGRTDMDGSIKATGAGSGNGGNVETSGKGQLALQGSVNVNGGSTGKGGQWLLDPNNISISNAASSNLDAGAAPDFKDDASATNAVVNATALGNAITGGAVINVIANSAGTAGTGRISVVNAVTAAGAGTLNLIAADQISVNSPITAATGQIFNVGIYSGASTFQGTSNTGVITATNLTVQGATGVDFGGVANNISGNVAMKSGTGQVSFNNIGGFNIGSTAANGTLYTATDGITAATGVSIIAGAGNVTQSASKNLVAGASRTVTLSGDAAYTLTNTGNTIERLVVNAGAGALDLVTSGALAVLAGGVARTGNISLTTGAGILSATGDVTSTAGNVSLRATGVGAAIANGVATSGAISGATVTLAQTAGSAYGFNTIGSVTATTLNVTLDGVTASANAGAKVYDSNTSIAANFTPVFARASFRAGANLSLVAMTGTYTNSTAGNTKAVTPNIGVQLTGFNGAMVTNVQTGGANLQATATGNITKKALSITANDETRIAGGALYSGGNGVVYSGFVVGESAANLTGALTYSGTAQGENAVGVYTISPVGFTSANYLISRVDGQLNLTAAMPVVVPPVVAVVAPVAAAPAPLSALAEIRARAQAQVELLTAQLNVSTNLGSGSRTSVAANTAPGTASVIVLPPTQTGSVLGALAPTAQQSITVPSCTPGAARPGSAAQCI